MRSRALPTLLAVLLAAASLTACSSPSTPNEGLPLPAQSAEPTGGPTVAGYPRGPAATPLTGENESLGAVTIVLPDGFTLESETDDGKTFTGPAIPESRSPDGTSSTMETIVLRTAVPAPGWTGEIEPAADEAAAQQDVYTLDVPGAELASMRFVSLDPLPVVRDQNGEEHFVGADGRATIAILNGEELTWVSFTTSPGWPGKAKALAFAAGITVT